MSSSFFLLTFSFAFVFLEFKWIMKRRFKVSFEVSLKRGHQGHCQDKEVIEVMLKKGGHCHWEEFTEVVPKRLVTFGFCSSAFWGCEWIYLKIFKFRMSLLLLIHGQHLGEICLKYLPRTSTKKTSKLVCILIIKKRKKSCLFLFLFSILLLYFILILKR